MAHSTLTYLRLKVTWMLLRGAITLLKIFKKPVRPERYILHGGPYSPTRFLEIPRTVTSGEPPSSSKPSRSIRLRVHDGPKAGDGKKKGVHINSHAAGFSLDAFGDNADFCHFLADKTNRIVIDADSSKAPEYPFPCAINDHLSLIAFLYSPEGQEKIGFDPAQGITVSGFSSGANLIFGLVSAIAIARQDGTLDPQAVPDHAIRAIVFFYGQTDMTPASRPLREAAQKEYVSDMDGGRLPMGFLDLIHDAYHGHIPVEDLKDPRLSGHYADPTLFPPGENILMIVGEYDALRREIELTAKKFNTKFWKVQGVAHAWDMYDEEGTPASEKRKKAWEMAVETIVSASS